MFGKQYFSADRESAINWILLHSVELSDSLERMRWSNRVLVRYESISKWLNITLARISAQFWKTASYTVYLIHPISCFVKQSAFRSKTTPINANYQPVNIDGTIKSISLIDDSSIADNTANRPALIILIVKCVPVQYMLISHR